MDEKPTVLQTSAADDFSARCFVFLMWLSQRQIYLMRPPVGEEEENRYGDNPLSLDPKEAVACIEEFVSDEEFEPLEEQPK